MNGDYLSIKTVENGFVLEMNAYSSGSKRRVNRVARDERELYALIAELYPVPELAEDEAENRREACIGANLPANYLEK